MLQAVLMLDGEREKPQSHFRPDPSPQDRGSAPWRCDLESGRQAAGQRALACACGWAWCWGGQFLAGAGWGGGWGRGPGEDTKVP